MGANVKLTDGREIALDVSGVTVKEWRDFVSPNTPDKNGDALIAKVTGLEVSAVEGLLYADYRTLVREIVRACNTPAASVPN